MNPYRTIAKGSPSPAPSVPSAPEKLALPPDSVCRAVSAFLVAARVGGAAWIDVGDVVVSSKGDEVSIRLRTPDLVPVEVRVSRQEIELAHGRFGRGAEGFLIDLVEKRVAAAMRARAVPRFRIATRGPQRLAPPPRNPGCKPFRALRR